MHALALFLFAQSYMRQTQLQSTMDVWPASPGESGGGPGEPASPARRVPHTNSGALPSSHLPHACPEGSLRSCASAVKAHLTSMSEHAAPDRRRHGSAICSCRQ